MKHEEVFQWDGVPVGFTHKIKHHIQLKPGAIPINHKNRKFSEEQNKFIDEEVQKLIKQDVVKPSTSNWSSCIVLSWEERKKRYRLCIDYRGVNALLIPPMAHPIPNIEEVIDQFRGQRFFHTLDLYQGYNQVQLSEDSHPITAFSTRKGLFEYTSLPFGLASGPTTYQALMQSILGELCWKVVVVFIDDLIIFGRTYEEALERLIQVLGRLREAKLNLRLFQRVVEFLGFVISEDGVKTCKPIVEAITNFPTPTNVKAVQRFLGIANYYRSFIKSHSQILEPLMQLTRKGVPFKWTDQCQAALDTLKERLTTAPVRHYYDPQLPIVLTTDASGRGIGSTVSQVDREGNLVLLAYGSRVLKPSEVSWSVTEKEAFAIVYFVKKYKHYLSKPFIVFSDHNSLRYVSTMRDSSNKIGRWLNYLMQFTFEVHHRPGDSREMVVADVLSRMMEGMEPGREERLALRMEKPILRLYSAPSSPILSSWFRVEHPREEDFDENGQLVDAPMVEKLPRERGSQLGVMLRRMEKEVKREGRENLRLDEVNCHWVDESEVEYLD